MQRVLCEGPTRLLPRLRCACIAADPLREKATHARQRDPTVARRFEALQRSIFKRMGIEIAGDGTSVPPDFVIAQRASLVPIQEIARKAGLQDSEIDLYGTFKAKVRQIRCQSCTDSRSSVLNTRNDAMQGLHKM